MIIGIQLLGILFGIIMIYFSILYYKKKNYNKKSLTLWLITWFAVIIIFAIPEIIYRFMDLLAIQRTADFFTAGAIIFLTTIVFYLYTVVKKTQYKMEHLVRELAIKEAKQQPIAKRNTKRTTTKK